MIAFDQNFLVSTVIFILMRQNQSIQPADALSFQHRLDLIPSRRFAGINQYVALIIRQPQQKTVALADVDQRQTGPGMPPAENRPQD